MRLFIRLCAAGLLSYAFPRLLIAAGVPLDAWILKMGTWLGASADWFNADLAVWVFTVILGIVLFGVETWWRPFQRIWQWAVPGAPQANNNTERVFIRARNTTGTKIIGNIFKGNRTHINADGSTDLEAASNVHLESGQENRNRGEEKEPDVSVWDLFNRMVGDHPDFAKLINQVHKFRQKAFDGLIEVWGRENEYGVRKKLPRGYWEFYSIDIDSLFRDDSHRATTKLAVIANKVSEPKMIRLETVRRQVEQHLGEITADARRQVVPLINAFRWVIDNSKWGPWDKSGRHLDIAATEIRSAAQKGEIRICGRPEIERNSQDAQFDQIWVDIDPAYWTTHEFDERAVMEGGMAHPETRVVSLGNLSAIAAPSFAMLRLYQYEMEKRWPAVNT